MRLKLFDLQHSPPSTWSRSLHSNLKDPFLLSTHSHSYSAFRCTHVTRISPWSVRMPPLSWLASSLVHSLHVHFVLSTGCIEYLRFFPEFIPVIGCTTAASPSAAFWPGWPMCFLIFHFIPCWVTWVRDKSCPFRWDVMRETVFFN